MKLALFIGGSCLLLLSCSVYVDTASKQPAQPSSSVRATTPEVKSIPDRDVSQVPQAETPTSPASTPVESDESDFSDPGSIPSFTGEPGEAFNAFIRDNIGRIVLLRLTFTEPPFGYRDGKADPFFESAVNDLYFIDCEDADGRTEIWTNRCDRLTWDASRNKLSGVFKVSQPRGGVPGTPNYNPDRVIFTLVSLSPDPSAKPRG